MERSKSLLTFLFTDIEGSMRLWDTDSDAMSRALERHDWLVQHVIGANGGRVFATTGDGFGAVFQDADSAVAAALRIQIQMAAERTWPRLRVRAGIHTGPAEERAGNFYGPTLNHCARLTEAAAGGQIHVSCDSMAALSGPVEALCLGERELRDLARPMRVYQIIHPSLRNVGKEFTEVSA